MKLEESHGGVSSADGLAALALVTAMINALPTADQHAVLTAAAALLPAAPGYNRDDARRMIGAMFAQIGP
jgi:hypothetical protein